MLSCQLKLLKKKPLLDLALLITRKTFKRFMKFRLWIACPFPTCEYCMWNCSAEYKLFLLAFLIDFDGIYNDYKYWNNACQQDAQTIVKPSTLRYSWIRKLPNKICLCWNIEIVIYFNNNKIQKTNRDQNVER
jgi:hypothetical protein